MLHYILPILGALSVLGGIVVVVCMAVSMLIAVRAKPAALKSMRVEFNRDNKGVNMEWHDPAPPQQQQSDARPRLVRDEDDDAA